MGPHTPRLINHEESASQNELIGCWLNQREKGPIEKKVSLGNSLASETFEKEILKTRLDLSFACKMFLDKIVNIF